MSYHRKGAILIEILNIDPKTRSRFHYRTGSMASHCLPLLLLTPTRTQHYRPSRVIYLSEGQRRARFRYWPKVSFRRAAVHSFISVIIFRLK